MVADVTFDFRKRDIRCRVCDKIVLSGTAKVLLIKNCSNREAIILCGGCVDGMHNLKELSNGRSQKGSV